MIKKHSLISLFAILFILNFNMTMASDPPDCAQPDSIAADVFHEPTSYYIGEVVGSGTLNYDIPFGSNPKLEISCWEMLDNVSYTPSTHGYYYCTSNGYSWDPSSQLAYPGTNYVIIERTNDWISTDYVQDYLFHFGYSYSITATDNGWSSCQGNCGNSISGLSSSISLVLNNQYHSSRLREFTIPELISFESNFQYLNYWNMIVTGNESTGYNCHCWAILHNTSTWLDSAMNTLHINSYIEEDEYKSFVENLGYTECQSYEAIIVVYRKYNPNTFTGWEVTHSARISDITSGHYESKMGQNARIDHSPSALDSSLYGSPYTYFKN
jgi:hypothetical protein